MYYFSGFVLAQGQSVLGDTKAEIENCDAGHSPMLSETDLLVKRIVVIAEKAVS
jgi:hypothetical protein